MKYRNNISQGNGYSIPSALTGVSIYCAFTGQPITTLHVDVDTLVLLGNTVVMSRERHLYKWEDLSTTHFTKLSNTHFIHSLAVYKSNIIIGTWNGVISIYDMPTQEYITSISYSDTERPAKYITMLQEHIVVAEVAQELQVWDLQSRQCIRRCRRGHDGWGCRSIIPISEHEIVYADKYNLNMYNTVLNTTTVLSGHTNFVMGLTITYLNNRRG